MPSMPICSDDTSALMGLQAMTEGKTHDIAHKRFPAVALTRLIFGTDALCALGRKIALLADMPLECSECHKFCPSTLQTPNGLVLSGGGISTRRSPYISGSIATTHSVEAGACEGWRKGYWCLQCSEHWNRQKRDIHEAWILCRYVNAMGYRSGVPCSVDNQKGADEGGRVCDASDVMVACPWIVLERNGQPKEWYWGPQPKCLWHIHFMTSCTVGKSCSRSFKEFCAQHGVMLVRYCGSPALYCTVCGKYGDPTHFNEKHTTKCTRSEFSQVIRPGCDEHGREYTTTLLEFYEELVYFPLFWGTELWAHDFP